MAYDKIVDSTQLNADLTSVANAIRTKGETSEALAFPSGFVTAIAAIPIGGVALASLDIYIADYLTAPPTITSGVLDVLSRRVYGT